jgi:hypothetical protein
MAATDAAQDKHTALRTTKTTVKSKADKLEEEWRAVQTSTTSKGPDVVRGIYNELTELMALNNKWLTEIASVVTGQQNDVDTCDRVITEMNALADKLKDIEVDSEQTRSEINEAVVPPNTGGAPTDVKKQTGGGLNEFASGPAQKRRATRPGRSRRMTKRRTARRRTGQRRTGQRRTRQRRAA